MEKINELTSENIVQQNIERLKEIFPTAFSEGKLVIEELQALVGEYIQKDKEYYQMTWAGKTEAQREANKVSTGTLRPCKEESKDWDSTGNIFIEGDNLEVLKLLQKSYSNKIKMIYIDPPYNTGNDFVYEDDFSDNLKNYLNLTQQTDETGRKLSTNSDSDGRYHSKWLTHMYPRLKLARNLLKDDGIIFISIDDKEQSNLKKICDEIFGEENFIANVIWQSRTSISNDHKVSMNHNHTLIYTKSLQAVKFGGEQLKADEYINPDNDPRGAWKLVPIDANHVGGATYYPIKNPKTNVDYYPPNGRIWAYNIDGYNTLYSDGRIKFGVNDDSSPKKKLYLNERLAKGDFKTPSSILLDAGTTKNGTTEIMQLFDNKKVFDYPKPTTFIKRLINYALVSDDDFVLDFFAGSGSTSHAVLALNGYDGKKRKCISVQLPEPTDEKSEAYKAGFKTIAEITKERIRRAGEIIKKENKDKEGIENLDTGFRVFKLDSSNIQAWDTSVDEFEGQLDMFAENNGDHIKNSRTEEDVLFEILLKYGLELTLPIDEKVVGECKIYNIGFGSMYICLSDHIKTDVAKAIGEWHKESSDTNPSVIFKDSGFANDADKTNTVQTLRQVGIENVKSI